MLLVETRIKGAFRGLGSRSSSETTKPAVEMGARGLSSDVETSLRVLSCSDKPTANKRESRHQVGRWQLKDNSVACHGEAVATQ